jgi:hypothetical protein
MGADKVDAKLAALLVHAKSEKNRDSWTTWEFLNWSAPKVEMQGLTPPVPRAINNSPSMQKALQSPLFLYSLIAEDLRYYKEVQLRD